MPQTVKGVISRSKGADVEVVDVVVPDPGPGEALVKIQACGVCHTDLHYREGGINDDFPFLLGHEAAGVVEAVGEGVTDVAPGDFVILNWRAVCGQCRACAQGQAVVLLRHPQRDAEDDARPTAPSCRRRWASARSPRRRSSRPGSAPRSTRAPTPPRSACSGCGVMAGLGAAINTGDVGRGDSVAVIGCGGVGDAAIAGAAAGRRDDDHRRRHRRPEARAGQGVRRHPHGQRDEHRPGRGDPRPHRRQRRRRRASRRSAAPRPTSRRSTPATSPARSCWSACRPRTCSSSCR